MLKWKDRSVQKVGQKSSCVNNVNDNDNIMDNNECTQY